MPRSARAPSARRTCAAVSRRKVGSPAVDPYCSASRLVLGERRISFNNAAVSSTGNESRSVNPAAREINRGRDNAECMSQEIGGSAVRRPISDKADLAIVDATNVSRVCEWDASPGRFPGTEPAPAPVASSHRGGRNAALAAAPALG